jgi:hypothetical protein
MTPPPQYLPHLLLLNHLSPGAPSLRVCFMQGWVFGPGAPYAGFACGFFLLVSGHGFNRAATQPSPTCRSKQSEESLPSDLLFVIPNPLA